MKANIKLVSGKPRNGKTLLVAYEGLCQVDNGGKCHGNFSLFDCDGKGAWVKDAAGVGHWSGVAPDGFEVIGLYDLVKLFLGERCDESELILAQEWYGWLTSYRGMSDAAMFQASLIFQSGKLGYKWCGDSQVSKRVDNSVRLMADERFEAVRESLCERERCIVDCPHLDDCVFRYYELDVGEPNEDVRTGDYFDIPFSFACQFWERYDTYARTPMLGLGSMVAKMAKSEPEVMNAVIDRQVKLLLDKKELYGLNRGRLTAIKVKDALLREFEVPVFYSYVLNRLELQLVR